MFTGGAFSQASVLLWNYALSFASIVVQLMGCYSLLQKLQSDGESGRKRLIKLRVG
jgi:preprotein translocase subunit SecY